MDGNNREQAGKDEAIYNKSDNHESMNQLSIPASSVSAVATTCSIGVWDLSCEVIVVVSTFSRLTAGDANEAPAAGAHIA